MADSKGPNGGVPGLAVARAMLATASGKKKLDLLLSSADAKGFVRSLPAEDLYFAVRDIGLADAAEVVELASPGQFRAFVDLDAWERDQVDPSRVLAWLRLALEGGPEGLRRKRKGLDSELLVLLLKTQTIIHELEEGVDPVLTSDNWVTTAERKYIVEITAEGDDGLTTRRLVEDFIDESPFEATRLFEAVRWELQSELEETGARWRRGRLRDMGFPEFEEALRIWRPLEAGWKPRAQAPGVGHVAGVPALLLAGSRRQLFLDQVAAKLPDDARGSFNEGLVYLLNCAIVADGVEPRELELARTSVGAARDQLSLGLELASDGDETRALAVLLSTPPVELFRLAVTRLAELQKEANAAARPLLFGQGGQLALDPPDAETLAGLRRKRPRLFDAGQWRPLRDRLDIQRAEEAIARARLAAAVLGSLEVTVTRASGLAEQAGRAPTAVTASQLSLTAAVREALGLGSLEPLSPEELTRLPSLFAGEKLTALARARLERFFDERAPQASAVTREWIDRLEAEVGPPVARGELDPRFVEAVLVLPAAERA